MVRGCEVRGCEGTRCEGATEGRSHRRTSHHRTSHSEGYIVVGNRLHRRLVRGRGMRGSALHAAAACPSPAEQRDPVGFDFGGVALVALFVVPLARLEAALDVDLLTLDEVLLQA